MRKIRLNGIALSIAVLGLASCKTAIKTQTADVDYLYFTKHGITQKPLITDLDVAKQKTTITMTYENLSVSEAKDAAMGDFIQQTNCDLIVQPYFYTTTTTQGTKSSISVTLLGYPAGFKNIRGFELKDTSLLVNTNPVLQSSPSKK